MYLRNFHKTPKILLTYKIDVPLGDRQCSSNYSRFQPFQPL